VKYGFGSHQKLRGMKYGLLGVCVMRSQLYEGIDKNNVPDFEILMRTIITGR